MANTFSFEDALKPQASQGFSFEDALKPAEVTTFSFDDAFKPVASQAEPEPAAPVAAQEAPPAPVAAQVPQPASQAPSAPQAPVATQEAPPAQPASQAPVAEQVPQPAPQEYPPYEPVQSELSAYEPSFVDRLGRMLGLGPNRDRASVELAARKIAKEQGMSVGEVYKQAGGSRGVFNPEGRATLPAIGEAAVVAGQSAQDIPLAFANTALRAIRGGDISGGEGNFLDYAIKQTETPDRNVDKNYEDLGGLGKSLGYSFATMGASIISGATAGLITANPLVGGATMMGTSGTVSYRASKDEFLDRVKTQLNNKTKQLYGRELTKDEWQSVRGDFESAAIKYGSWEAATEAVGNLLMVKAFSAPAKGMSKPALNKLVERAASIGVENIGETATGVGQRQAEIEAGLSKEELSVKDAFKQQFLSTLLLGGTMAAGAKGKEFATDFYQKYVEPKVSPQSALGRAIMADLEDAVINPQGVDAQAISALQGAQAPTLDELATQKDAQQQKKVEPKLTPDIEPPEQPTAEQTQADKANFDALNAEYQSIITEAQKYPAGSVENQEATQRALNFFDTNILPLIETPMAIETLEVLPLQGDITTSTAPGISVSYPRERTEPTFTVDPETGEVIPAPTAPVKAESNPAIERRALELRQVNGYPAEVALSVARKEFAEGDLNAEPISGEQPGAEAVAGRIEPSVSLPSEGAATTEGVAPLDIDGLDKAVGAAGEPVVGAGVQRTALDESLIPTLTERAPTPDESLIPTLTERAPAPTYAQLPAEDKAPVLEEAQQMWQAGEATLPIAKAWNSLPSWKRDMFAAQVYENYDEITTNPEAFRTAMDKVVEAKKPADAEAAVTKVKAPVAPVEQQIQRTEEEQLELERVDAENNIGKPQLRKRLESGQLPIIDSSSQGDGSITYFAKGVGSTNPDFLVTLDPTPEEKRAAKIAEADIELADSQEERETARKDLAKALQPAAERALAVKTTAVAAATTPEAKKEATAQLNVARQEAKKAEAAAPAEVFDAAYFKKEFTRLKNKRAAAEKVERRAEMGPAKTAAEQKLAKIDQEIDAFRAKQDPLLKAAADKTIAESEEREAKKAEAAAPTIPPVETTAKPAVKKWFGNSKAVDSKGEPLVLYRGLVGGEVDPFLGRAGYAIFTSDNPYIASSYSGDPTAEFGVAGGVVYPMYAKVDTVIEFPVDANGVFDKFEFDKRAKNLKPGESLVARNVMDTGPRMSTKMAAEYTKKSGDVWAFANGTKFQSAISPTAPKRGRPAKAPVEGAEAKTPKPRGRRKIELTPEEQARKDAERGINQAEAIKAGRDVDKLINFLSSEFDPANTKSPDFTKVATQGLDSVRREYIYKLHEFATNNAYRTKPASGGKARDFLANSDKITRKERADLQTRLKFEETRPPKPSAARAKSSGKVNPALYEFETATQAIDHIMLKGTPFERLLAARLKPFVTDVNLSIATTKEDTPEKIALLIENPKKDISASGVYSSARFGDKVHRMIVLRGENFGNDPSLQGVNNTIFLHEALHAATEAKIYQWQELTKAGKPVPPGLQQAISGLFSTMAAAQIAYEDLQASGKPIAPNLRHKMEELDVSNDITEFVTYGLTDADMQNFLLATPGSVRKDRPSDFFKNLFTRFVVDLRKIFNMKESDTSALQDLMLVTEGLLQEQYYEPVESVNTVELNAKKEKVDKNLEKIRLSPDSKGMIDPIEQNVKDGHTYNDFNDLLQARLDAMGNGFISKTLATLQTADIIRWQGDAIPALKSIDTLVEKMAGSQMNMERAFTKKADQLARFVRKVGKKKQLLADAMHLARLNSVSPSLFKDRADAIATDKRMVQLDKLLANPATPQEELPTITRKRTIREGQINQTFDAWEKLGTLKGGHDMYRMVRQFYKDANVLTRTLLDERIERLNVEGSIDDPSTPKGKLMLAVRRMQEDSDFKGIDEYFPFMRYGNFWLRVNGPQGREFYLFESGTERNAFLTRRAKELGIDPKSESETFDAGDDLTALRTKYSPESKMLADMFETIDNEMDKPGVDKDALKDALYQTYLMTLPEESYRKQFLHAENVTGFSSDVLRNFTTSASRIASQSAKLTYGDQISAEVQRARDTLKGMPVLKKAKLELFVNEINDRVQQELNPVPESKAVTRINQFAYYSLLTGVASAITQTTALPMLVMPVLNQEYGYGSSAAKFAKYMALWQSVGVTQEGADGEVVYVAPTMGESRLVKNNPILQRAFQEAIDRGLTAQTNSSVLTNRNRTPDSAYSNIPRAALRTTATMMSSLFTGAERMTREMAYLMTFELEYAKTKDFDASVQKAVDTVQELLGRYDAFNRPRIMRNALGRTVGQFKMYAVNITSFFIRNGYNMATQAFKGNPKEALNAMHRLGGVLTMAAVFGGVTSFPMYSLVTSVIDLMLDAFGDDEEKKRRMAENPYTASSSDLRFRYEFLPQMFGDIKITGLDGKPRTLAAVLEKGTISELGDFNIGSRTTYDGMWFRDAKPGNTTQETVVNYLVANLGPAVSSGLSMTGAVDDFSDGKIARGLERIAPALFKNPLTAARLAKEGAKTPKGDVVMSKEEFSSFNIAMQSLGFQSTALARYQENKFKQDQEVNAAEKNKRDILGKLDNAILDSDASDKDLERVFERIDKHNDRYVALKDLRIGADTIKRVIDRAKDREGFMFRGMYIRKEHLPYLLELRDAVERPQK